ncbi:hypothetical protein BACCAP_00563 [Pseudoflavonifractor capillosus ATCC 29799]|uniref:Uncharacterized protein n=1 Tax=Pseudoflavonifractor capillosus ATCC 29799 TaxID=411467 RepID=A6NQU0_9FIRM|nr:hypothetical protein BACCAP_00563 [Pseudoflavonifractor capillosus ATCC 29799]
MQDTLSTQNLNFLSVPFDCIVAPLWGTLRRSAFWAAVHLPCSAA